jgi:hypothetical protein
MPKRWRKQKAGQQTAKKRNKIMRGDGDASSAAGTFGGMRRFAKRAAGSNRVQEILLWAVVAVLAFFVARKFMR